MSSASPRFVGSAFGDPHNPDMSRPLNPKQQKFVDRYLATGNDTQSYIDAGYTARDRAAANAASRLLGFVGVKAAIDEARAEALKTHEVTAEWTLRW